MEQHGALHGIKVLDFTISVVGKYHIVEATWNNMALYME